MDFDFGSSDDDEGFPRTQVGTLPIATNARSSSLPVLSQASAIEERSAEVLDRAITLATEALFRPNLSELYRHFSWDNLWTRPIYSALDNRLTNRALLEMPQPVIPAQAVLRTNSGSLLSAAIRRVKAVSWPAQQAGIRHKSLQTWRTIIEENLNSTILGQQLHQMALNSATESQLAECIEDAFAQKKSSTLVKRGASLLKYLIWHRTLMGISGLPLTELRAYEYLKTLQSKGAPTAPASFMSSVNFSLYFLKLDGAKEIAESARIRGVVFSSTKRKRLRNPSRRLLVDEVASLEHQSVTSKCMFDRYACLFFLNCCFARSRYTGMCHANSILDDLDEFDEGFIEAPTLNAKIQAISDKASFLLPLVAPATGVTGLKWGALFMKERRIQGLDKMKYILPTPGVDGNWIDEPTSVGDAAKWLRDLLQQAGHKNLESVATHSLKATPLSWAAKWGSPLPLRSLLGYHISGEVTSTLTYSRDSQAAPLRELIEIITAIREKRFMPDLSRSGRIFSGTQRQSTTIPAVSVRSDNPGKEIQNHSQGDVECIDDPYILEQAPDQDSELGLKAVSDSNTSSDSESDSESSVDETMVKELSSTRKSLPLDLDGLLPYVHKRSAVLHCRLVDHTKLKCGRLLTSTYTKSSWDQTLKILRCAQCFR